MAAKDHVVMHIGTSKTGSSLIQGALRRMRKTLVKKGVVFVDRNDFTLPERRGWGAYGREGYSKERFETSLTDRLEVRTRATRRPRMMLISNESIVGSIRPEYGNPLWHRAHAALSELMAIVQPRRATIILYVRRQDRLLESMYMQRIHEGKTTKWEKFRTDTCLDTRADYNVLLDSITSVPGVDEVKVQPFEVIGAGGRAFVIDFLEMADLGFLADEVGEVTPINASYTDKAWKTALSVNRALDDLAEARKVRRFLNELFPADQYRRADLLSDDQRLEMIETYREVNEKFFDTYLPQYPRDSYSSLVGTEKLAGVLDPAGVPPQTR